MKFVHISDLHIGKRLNEYSLIEDQRYILGEIVRIINENAPDCVFIAGDVYDKSVPSAEAVSLLDEFFDVLGDTGAKTFVISGNHDSAERIAYGESAFKKQGIYLSKPFRGTVEKAELTDEYGKMNIYLLPFIKPAHVNAYVENADAKTYTEAIAAVIKSLGINNEERNVVLAHQYVTGAQRRDSEEVPIGGLDNVEGFVFDEFDYVALGHIHTCQKIGRDTMRYSGTPLKYSASEAGDTKYVVVGEMREKGNTVINKIPLVPIRDYVDIKGKLEDIIKSENKTDFVRVTLTDDETVVDAYGKLKTRYPYITELVFERKRHSEEYRGSFDVEKAPDEQFGEFFSLINGRELTDEQEKLVRDLFEGIKEDAE